MESYTCLLYEEIGRVARLTLNQPEKVERFKRRLSTELLQAAKQAEADPRIHAVVIRGAGVRSVPAMTSPQRQSGGPQATRTIRGDISRMEETVGRWQMLWNLRIPTIAQVHGYCVAGGRISLHCDMIVVAEDARIGFTPVRAMGTPPTHMWLYSVGPQWAKRLLLTGDLIDGKMARDIGWAIAAVLAATLDDTASSWPRISHIGRHF